MEIILGVIAIMAISLSTSLFLRSKQYDGTLMVTQNEYGSTITLSIDPTDLILLDHVKLKVIPPPEDRIENKD